MADMADMGCLGCLPGWLRSTKRIAFSSTSLEEVRPLGEGAFSTVTLCRTSSVLNGYPPALYALKKIVIQRENSHLVQREVRAHQLVKGNPHVLDLVAHETRGTANADVMEALLLFPLCDGGTLAEMVNGAGGLKEATAVDIFGQLAAAIAHCHASGVIHRDIKLTNIYHKDGCWVLACAAHLVERSLPA